MQIPLKNELPKTAVKFPWKDKTKKPQNNYQIRVCGIIINFF